jgi:hypothetical protein
MGIKVLKSSPGRVFWRKLANVHGSLSSCYYVKHPLKSQGIYRQYLNAALFEHNGELTEIAEDLNYNGYRKTTEMIERFLPDIRKYLTLLQQNPDTIGIDTFAVFTGILVVLVACYLKGIRLISGRKAGG